MRELVVNLHVTERCNYSCSFCFGKWPAEQQTAELFRDATKARAVIETVFYATRKTLEPGDVNIRFNFAGGEPGLLNTLPELVEYCRSLGARVSFVSNGLVLQRLGIAWTLAQIDIVGISIDSVVPDTNRRIGRMRRDGKMLDLTFLASCFAQLQSDGGPETKVNTVVSSHNYDEDLSTAIRMLNPHKWKIFQALPVYDTDSVVTRNQYKDFLARHQEFSDIIVSEDNEEMTGSYIMIDPLGRFFWRDPACRHGYRYSVPILEIGARRAFDQIPISWEKYGRRYARSSAPVRHHDRAH
jgi:radical S-adenosyl methionine domain-containing protein 2